MTKEELYNELAYVNHSRENRLKYAHLVIDKPELLTPLLEILFNVDDAISPRAAWVLEFMCGKKLNKIMPHLNYFVENISRVHLDSAVRPVAKICEYLIKANYTQPHTKLKITLSPFHKEKIIEACFDWMISDQKIAPKAYAMHALYLLGNEYEWIHSELENILKRDFQTQSAGFKARARHILKKIENNKPE